MEHVFIKNDQTYTFYISQLCMFYCKNVRKMKAQILVICLTGLLLWLARSFTLILGQKVTEGKHFPGICKFYLLPTTAHYLHMLLHVLAELFSHYQGVNHGRHKQHVACHRVVNIHILQLYLLLYIYSFKSYMIKQ
jgi:hypothetical protein